MYKRPKVQRASAISLALVIALSGAIPASFADSSVSIYQKLGEYEKVLFGKPESSIPIDKRLSNIEKQLFGKSTKGSSTSERIQEIEKVMNGKNGTTYLPPIAPELDRSEFAPTPKQAPDNPDVSNNDISRPQDAPVAADTSDRVKGLLRQAMQNYSAGKTTEAERLYQQVLGLDFRNVDANYNLGAIAETKNDLNAAKRYYTAAIKGSPGDQDIQDALTAVQQKLKARDAAKATTPVVSPTSSPASSELAGAPSTAGDRAIAQEAADSYKHGNFDDAIQKLTFLAKKNPYDANTQFALGQALRGKGKMPEALAHLRSAATLDSKNDLYVKTLNDVQSYADEQQTASASGAGSSGSVNSNSSSSGGSSDVTPFTGLPDSAANSTLANSGDLSAIESYLRRNAGNVMMGSVTSSGYGGPSMGYSSMGGLPMSLGTASGGTRLRRIMTSSLTGAAIGAMSNRGYPGGMSKGAMRGAMYGGLFGLMLGGF